MLAGTVFFFLRILQIITLIPIWGILAWFVDKANDQGLTPPDTVLCLFVVAVLATVWALATLFLFHRSRFTDLWVAIVDICVFGVLIAGVVLLGRVAENTDCVNGWSSGGWLYWNGGVRVDRTCSMYKAAWGLGILNVLLFFATAVMAGMIWRRGRGATVGERRGRYW
ncbi:uncharacterized protein H6S33_012216 [Morchella sextelata]|uniref:uncharacterized protein n=1 Tax=Morchella sextelata TaxID=1174677 RepID=UPI001D0374E8|nr:uncharacterized protein H6S33_012216 [Morchella sextelata]KAH0610689.1 hypothetical protein H6S33_012216 [Morchella sextelata]